MEKIHSFIPWWKIQYTDEDAESTAQAVRNGHLSLGPITTKFEKQIGELLQIPYVVATTSGSMALLMSLLAIGIGTDDEVIIPNRTWIAAAHAVLLLGAKPVFVDVLENIPNIDTTLIENKITNKTKAIIPTSLNGRAVDLEVINELAKKYNLKVIEDAAQAMCSQSHGKFVGTQALISCFSLSVAKLLPTGQGGLIVTHDANLYRDLIKIRTHGVDNLFACNFTQLGFNFRFTDLQASLGLSQLQQVDKKIQLLKQLYLKYENNLKDLSSIRLIPVNVEAGELPLYIEVLCDDRQRFVEHMNTYHIETKDFYPNLNRAPHLRCNENFYHSNKFETFGVTLPSGPDQDLNNINRVIEAIHDYELMNHKNKKIVSA